MGIHLIVKNEFMRSMKSKKKLIITLFAPVIAVVLAICINTIMKPSINLGIIDKENSEIGESFRQNTEKIEGIKIDQANEDTINTDLIMAKYVATIEFDKNNSIKLYCLDNELKDKIKGIVNDFTTTGKLTGLQSILTEIRQESMTAAERSSGFIVLTLVVTCIFIACNILKDKEDGVLRRYILSGNAPKSYILGNLIFNFLITLLQIIISTLVIWVFRVNLGINIIQYLVIGAVIAFISVSIATLLVSIMKTELKASLMASTLAMVMSLLGGAFLPLEKMPYGIKVISNISITKWLIAFTRTLENRGYSVQELIPAMIIMLMSVVFIVVSLVVGKRKFV